ncbi:MmcQ/YjbR family DNA-binding protein [Nocardioides sp. YIM 152315]|uniref:MmcQ/YjbR family DNA-binding protein n=1 Tax=Nocardioides sp. YIM 152315 TaxID=3031760 RepID=UPI0023DA6333|nr:MmcQ/YjbR family DNA-binding protein [Nocardioides sp. YIM 152315]MDF1603951.1 MmcQ/YjbR family DNA-binding protein [Nocardioides sp. YIM 152315]
MSPEEVHEYAVSLAGTKRKGTPARPAWYVRNRLVARLEDSVTLTVRVHVDDREPLVEAHPDTFGVPPRHEAHHKVEAYLDHGDASAIREAIRLAWEFQRSW